MVRTQQVRNDFFTWTRRAPYGPPFEERPQPLANRRRQHAFEILESRPPKMFVVGLKAAKRNLQRFALQHQRQERKDVGEALARPVPHERVERRFAGESIEQPSAFPDRTADRHFPEHDVENPAGVDLDPRILLDDGGQRSCRLATNVEPEVVEGEHEAVRRALRHADREHARQAAADGKLLVRIDQGVDQLAHPLLRHLPQRKHGVVGHRIPRQQRNRVRAEAGRQPICSRQHFHYAVSAARAQRQIVVRTRIEQDDGRFGVDSKRRVLHVGVPDTAHQRPVRAVFHRDIDPATTADEAGFERVDVPAIQTARGDNGARGADDGEPEDRRRLGGGEEHHRESHEPPADGVSQTIERHVDQRFGRPLLRRRNRRVEQFVSRAIQRAPEHRLAATRGDQAAESRRDEAGQAAHEQRPGRRARRHAQTKPLEHGAARRRLDDERDDARGRVIEGEEASRWSPRPNVSRTPPWKR